MAYFDYPSPVALWPAPTGRSGREMLSVAGRAGPAGAVVVTVRGEMEMTTSSLLRDQLMPRLQATHHLVLDLSEVTLLCAAGLTVLVIAREAALVAGTRLCVVAHSRPVRMPLVVTGLTNVLDLHTDLADALLCPAPRLVHPRRPR